MFKLNKLRISFSSCYFLCLYNILSRKMTDVRHGFNFNNLFPCGRFSPLGGKSYINLTFVWFMHLVFNTRRAQARNHCLIPPKIRLSRSPPPLFLSLSLSLSVRVGACAKSRLFAAAPSLHSPAHFTIAFRPSERVQRCCCPPCLSRNSWDNHCAPHHAGTGR